MPGAPRPKTGPGTGPWNGIALFDHPENDGFPGTIGKYAVVQQVTQAHYPPAAPRTARSASATVSSSTTATQRRPTSPDAPPSTASRAGWR